jgi:hypothetical protein
MALLVFLKAVFPKFTMPPEGTASIPAIITFIVQYVIPERP